MKNWLFARLVYCLDSTTTDFQNLDQKLHYLCELLILGEAAAEAPQTGSQLGCTKPTKTDRFHGFSTRLGIKFQMLSDKIKCYTVNLVKIQSKFIVNLVKVQSKFIEKWLKLVENHNTSEAYNLVVNR